MIPSLCRQPTLGVRPGRGREPRERGVKPGKDV